MNAICLVFDRLHVGHLGAYGNAWMETPSLDRLASRSFLFDQMLIDSPDLERLYRSYWRGCHAMCSPRGELPPSLPSLLREAGVATALLTDEPRVARHELAVDFDELIEIDPPWQPQIARDLEHTHFGRCFVQILEWLECAKGPFLLWCHLGGLGTAWDAPLEYRQAYCEEGDPPPPPSAEAPDYVLPTGYDPDELLGVVQSYSGQVTLLDTCLGAFFEYCDSLPASEETLLTLTSARGFPLGEHRRIGACDGALFSELVHVPWLLQLPHGAGAAVRTPALMEPSDVGVTLLDSWNLGELSPVPTGRSALPLVRGEVETLRDRLGLVGSDGQRALRTPAWYLRTGEEPDLFVKPDDRWEINNVASRCRDVVEDLQEVLEQYHAAIDAGEVVQLPPLKDILRDGLE